MGRSAPPSSRLVRSDRPVSGNGRRAEIVQQSFWDESADERPRVREEFDLGGQLEPILHEVDLEDSRIDADAAKVVQRLTRHGFEAYLVGGCVRDLLVGMRPKDFDVATSARPEDIRKLFRNSRIIGRRFRLVHILFGAGKVIETATFRRAPRQGEEGESLLIRSDNAFGEAHEDAQRRDFTINGLFYDVEGKQVLDWICGMPDIEARTVQTIGDPIVRFFEDPVRILRAIKFSARLDFGIAPEVYDAMVFCRGALSQAAKPRLFEEMLRLMRCTRAHRAFWLCWEMGVLDVLLPELSAYLTDADDDGAVWRILSVVDRRMASADPPLDDAVLWTLLLLGPLTEACLGSRDRVGASMDFLEPLVDRLNMPRRIADGIRRIVATLPRLDAGRPGRSGRSGLQDLAQQVHDIRKEALADVVAEDTPQEPTKRRSSRRRARKKPAPAAT